jgi:hypothetical protein
MEIPTLLGCSSDALAYVLAENMKQKNNRNIEKMKLPLFIQFLLKIVNRMYPKVF